MGGKQSHSFDQNQFSSLWERRQTSGEGRTLWRNKRDPTNQIEQYPIYAKNDDQIEREQKLYDLRRNSSDLVAATHLKQTKKGGLCSNSAQGRLFLQRIPLKLQALQHIPFPDILHLNINALTGYKKLAKVVGSFRPQEQQIGFNSQGVAKVWLNGDYSLSQPGSVEQSQAAMVRNILQLIDDNSDRNTTPNQNPSIMNYVYKQNNQVSFDQAIRSVNEYAQRYNNGVVPSSLQCIKRVGIDHISKSLTTMRQNGAVTSLNNAPRSSFNNTQVLPPVYNSNINTNNIINTPIQHKNINTGSTFLPPQQTVASKFVPSQQNFTQKFVPPQQSLTSTFVPPQQTVASTFLPPQQTVTSTFVAPTQNVVNRQSNVNFSNFSVPVNQAPVQKIVNQVPVQQKVVQSQVNVHQIVNQQVNQSQVLQTVNHSQVQQSQVQSTIRPPIQQIIRQGPSQTNVVFGNKSIGVPLPVQQQRAVVNQSVGQVAQNQFLVSNVAQQQQLSFLQPKIVSQAQQRVVIPQQQPQLQQQQTSNFVAQQQVQQKLVPQKQIVQQQQKKIQNRQIPRNLQRVEQVRQPTQNRNQILQSVATGAFAQNKTYGISSSQQQDNLNYIQSTSSRFRDVSLQDGKSSSALLAQLRNLSTKVYTPDTTSNNTYNASNNTYKSYEAKQNYEDLDQNQYKSSNNYSSKVNDNSNQQYTGKSNNQAGYYGMFNKYATGNQDNLQNNLQMKYSMTQDQYQNQEYQDQQQYQNQYSNQQYSNQQYQNQYSNQQYQNEQYQHQYQNEHFQNQGQYNIDYDPQILADIQRMKN